ncbi:hypothetical protein [Dictyobacter kobayashii]|uniref:DUF4177 domain-containing protein n=1 Tax=Dictyobacter kobayashii TaxID=2014872 RepID=A0A402AGM6_9CHLR|nr:hypothetical protein [Dictyobacter kobayashii]GCE18239.1 hypothetical protein KDK_20390 [Dictyobacter kobayashii]
MGQWAYKVVYVDYRGRISCEGVETLIGDERRSAFVRRYFDSIGRDGWELASNQPLTANSAYYVFKRAAQEGNYADQTPPAAAQEAPTTPPPTTTEGSGPTIENV